MKKLFWGTLFVLIAFGTVAFLSSARANERRHYRWVSTEEHIAGTLAAGSEAGTDVAVASTNSAQSFCERIGRETIDNQVDFNADSHFETRIESENRRGYYHFFGPPVEKRIDAGQYTRSNVRLTCGTKK
jgi:hypothetical protein